MDGVVGRVQNFFVTKSGLILIHITNMRCVNSPTKFVQHLMSI